MGAMSLPNLGKFESLGILFTLLPGLVTYLIVHSLTAREKKHEAAEVILHALAYTLIVYAIWSFLTLKSCFPTPDLLGLLLTAITFGLCFAILVNWGIIYTVLQYYGLTGESAWHSIWYTTFRYSHGEDFEYALLYLKDKSKLRGAIRGYSRNQKDGHVALESGCWIDDDNNEIPADGLLLIPGEEITMIHFLPPFTEVNRDEQESNQNSSASTDSRPDGGVEPATKKSAAPTPTPETPTATATPEGRSV